MTVFVSHILAMGAHMTLKEHKWVINHFSNTKITEGNSQNDPEKPFYCSTFFKNQQPVLKT